MWQKMLQAGSGGESVTNVHIIGGISNGAAGFSEYLDLSDYSKIVITNIGTLNASNILLLPEIDASTILQTLSVGNNTLVASAKTPCWIRIWGTAIGKYEYKVELIK